MTSRGFTLIETLVAIALAAVLASAAALAASSLATALRLGATVRTLAQTMRETRARAMAEGAALDVVFDATTSSWRIQSLDGTTRRTQALPAPVRFTSLPVSPRVRFDATGSANNATIALGAGVATCRIVVNQRGRVRLG